MKKWLHVDAQKNGVITHILTKGETEAEDVCDKQCSLDNHFLQSGHGHAKGRAVWNCPQLRRMEAEGKKGKGGPFWASEAGFGLLLSRRRGRQVGAG